MGSEESSSSSTEKIREGRLAKRMVGLLYRAWNQQPTFVLPPKKEVLVTLVVSKPHYLDILAMSRGDQDEETIPWGDMEVKLERTPWPSTWPDPQLPTDGFLVFLAYRLDSDTVYGQALFGMQWNQIERHVYPCPFVHTGFFPEETENKGDP